MTHHAPVHIWRIIRNLKLSFLALVLMPVLVSAQAPGSQSHQAFAQKFTLSIEAEYLLDLPGDFDADSGKEWPLILFLHGAGERGDDLQKVAVHGPPKLAASHPALDPFIVVSPQCPEGERWDPVVLNHLLDHVIKKLPVDTSRIYLTGLSMGGYGTWALIGHSPHRFAAAAPICGGGDPIGIYLSKGSKREAIASLPVWNFHGSQDSVVPEKRSDVMVEAVTALGGDVRYTRYPNAGHDSWTATYSNPALYKWFLSHSR